MFVDTYLPTEVPGCQEEERRSLKVAVKRDWNPEMKVCVAKKIIFLYLHGMWGGISIHCRSISGYVFFDAGNLDLEWLSSLIIRHISQATAEKAEYFLLPWRKFQFAMYFHILSLCNLRIILLLKRNVRICNSLLLKCHLMLIIYLRFSEAYLIFFFSWKWWTFGRERIARKEGLFWICKVSFSFLEIKEFSMYLGM